MKIGEIANKTNLPASTLRYYEKNLFRRSPNFQSILKHRSSIQFLIILSFIV